MQKVKGSECTVCSEPNSSEAQRSYLAKGCSSVVVSGSSASSKAFFCGAATGRQVLTFIIRIIYVQCLIELCSIGASTPIGCSDHNIIAASRKAKVPKAGPKIVFKRSYNNFCSDSYAEDVKEIDWSNVCSGEHPHAVIHF